MNSFLGVVLSFTVATLSIGTPPERLAWNANLKIDWSQFTGMPSTTSLYAATTSTGLSQSYELDVHGFLNKAATTVTAHFYPEFSWYRPADTTATLLNHERAHFDITEIHAIKLRKRISEYVFTSNSKDEINQLYNEVEEERKQLQLQFDSETKHSRNNAQEEKWHMAIKIMLEE